MREGKREGSQRGSGVEVVARVQPLIAARAALPILGECDLLQFSCHGLVSRRAVHYCHFPVFRYKTSNAQLQSNNSRRIFTRTERATLTCRTGKPWLIDKTPAQPLLIDCPAWLGTEAHARANTNSLSPPPPHLSLSTITITIYHHHATPARLFSPVASTNLSS